MPTSNELRQKYNKFIYQSYSWKIVTDSKQNSQNNLKISFQYKIEPNISFSPTLTIQNVSQEMIDRLGKEKIDSYVFNIGLSEMFSYWKSTTSPIIEIKAGNLTQNQIDWWHKLLIKGMGEFFFVNNIKFTDNNFVKIVCAHPLSNENINPKTTNNTIEMKILVPIGGGKDSSVTLEILSNLEENHLDIGSFAVNPTQAALDIISAKNIKNKIEVKRTIDSKLLALNSQGYLNGHVPISAFFAFLSVFTADLFGYTHVAISNERSSNEGNTQFCNREINHQYSKTYEFEKDFQEYVKNYLPNAPLYFSFLRPLYELQIANIFSGKNDLNPQNNKLITGMKKYHQVFRSCNRGQKTNSWCTKCSKCLFAYVIIYPFLDDEKIHSYFGKDMFADDDLWPIAQELLGVGEKKPLECVGTHEETIIAFYLSIKKYLDSNQKLPSLLEKVNQNIISKVENLETRTQNILKAWNDNNSVPKQLEILLKNYIKTQSNELKNILDDIKSNRIIILGLGREGLSSYKFLRANFPEKKLLLIDKKSLNELADDWQKISENDKNIKFDTKIDKTQINKNSNNNQTYSNNSKHILVIKSPGISPTSPFIKQVKKIGAKLTSNTNIFFQLLKTLNSDIKTIGVTGTKGKSTTTSMINHVLKNCGVKTFFGGNIGIPPLSLWNEIEQAPNDTPPVVILEMSSHQLNDLHFSPSIAVILDVSPEHLDYYNSFDEYIKAKSQISRFQTNNDLVIFNNKQKIPTKLANMGKAKQLTFNFKNNVSNDIITYNQENIIDINYLPVLGKHNILNSIPSIIIAKQFGCSKSNINKSLKTFKPLPHRLEIVTNNDNVTYVNDSLSTTPKSTIAAINSFKNSPIILIVGGHDRNLEFSELVKIIIKNNIKHLILLPDTGQKILENVTAHTNKITHTFANNMKQAVKIAKDIAKSGDVVLLSPASASFGHFKDYKDRGNQFIKLVKEL